MCREETNPWTVVNPVQDNSWGAAAAEGLDSRRGAYQPNQASIAEKYAAQGQRWFPKQCSHWSLLQWAPRWRRTITASGEGIAVACELKLIGSLWVSENKNHKNGKKTQQCLASRRSLLHTLYNTYHIYAHLHHPAHEWAWMHRGLQECEANKSVSRDWWGRRESQRLMRTNGFKESYINIRNVLGIICRFVVKREEETHLFRSFLTSLNLRLF